MTRHKWLADMTQHNRIFEFEVITVLNNSELIDTCEVRANSALEAFNKVCDWSEESDALADLPHGSSKVNPQPVWVSDFYVS